MPLIGLAGKVQSGETYFELRRCAVNVKELFTLRDPVPELGTIKRGESNLCETGGKGIMVSASIVVAVGQIWWVWWSVWGVGGFEGLGSIGALPGA